jgi:predicted DNA-binding transcriptional regulator YafY
MPKDKEYGAKARLLRIMYALMERPYGYTKKELAVRYGVHPDTISNDFEIFREIGLELDRDERHRYAFVVNRTHQRIKELLFFSEEERALLHQAIDNLQTTPEKKQRLKNKLHSLYDYSRLGHAWLRRPHLTKVELLEQAKREKRQVVLEDYRSSNSNTVADRKVEPYHISPSEDTLQSFDVDKGEPRHFRLSRIARVRLLDTPWQFENRHVVQRTDPFRIVSNDQINVHLRLSVGAYNELVERYPLTRSYIEPTEDPSYFDFQCNVNRNFYGLTNFILGFYHLDIQVIAPEELQEHLRREVARMHFL